MRFRRLGGFAFPGKFTGAPQSSGATPQPKPTGGAEYLTGIHAQAVSDAQTATSQRVFRPLIVPAVAANPFQFVLTAQDGTPLQAQSASQVFPAATIPSAQPPAFFTYTLTVQMTWEQNASVTFPPVHIQPVNATPARFAGSFPQEPQWQTAPSAIYSPFRGASQIVARTVLSQQEARDYAVNGAIFPPLQVPVVTIGPFLTTLLSRQDPLPMDVQIAASQAVFNSAAFTVPIPPPPVVVAPAAGGSVPGHAGKKKRKKDGPYMRDDQVFGEEYSPSPFIAAKGLKSAGKRVQGKAAQPSDYTEAIRILMRELL